MKELEYPFDGATLLQRKKSLKKALLSDGRDRIRKKIAVLGGSTTHDLVLMLELFLLDQGIEPEFYQSEYNRYYEDGVFGTPALDSFGPDLIYIHTTCRNIPDTVYPGPEDGPQQVQEKRAGAWKHFHHLWECLEERFHCPIIQNNFEKPPYRLLGNMDAWDCRGREHFLAQLNEQFAGYAREHGNFYIQDIDWLAASVGLGVWHDPLYWHMYKYSPAVPAVPELAFNLSNMIKAIFGKNKKALVLDLDNTLWGGVVGDDGPENIAIGQETGLAQVYSEFQQYLKAMKKQGILLNIDSKNEMENALAGLGRPDSVLRPEDFIVIKANWEPKDRNLAEIAGELNIGTDALVFVDDNPAERSRVSQAGLGAAVPEMTEGHEAQPERYISILDRSGFFEPVSLSREDLDRSSMYQANTQRKRQEQAFADYGEYLRSLEMRAEVGKFVPEYMDRIAQLTNKSNQFNLTTRRYTRGELEQLAADAGYLTLYGKLSDRFGDNGVVNVILGRQEEDSLHIELWLMSCRVLKRGMEQAMLDTLAEQVGRRGVKRLVGYYYPTPKNGMVREFYREMGFSLVSEDAQGNTRWELELAGYEPKNEVIAIERRESV